MTKIITGPRGVGKTTQLIQLSAETGAIIVCTTGCNVDAVLNMANQMGLDIPLPITARQFIKKGRMEHHI